MNENILKTVHVLLLRQRNDKRARLVANFLWVVTKGLPLGKASNSSPCPELEMLNDKIRKHGLDKLEADHLALLMTSTQLINEIENLPPLKAVDAMKRQSAYLNTCVTRQRLKDLVEERVKCSGTLTMNSKYVEPAVTTISKHLPDLPEGITLEEVAEGVEFVVRTVHRREEPVAGPLARLWVSLCQFYGRAPTRERLVMALDEVRRTFNIADHWSDHIGWEQPAKSTVPARALMWRHADFVTPWAAHGEGQDIECKVSSNNPIFKAYTNDVMAAAKGDMSIAYFPIK